jgi:uncharacterized CHY-type Zn-finger protein
MGSHFDRLPADIIVEILLNLHSVRDLCRVRRVCGTLSACVQRGAKRWLLRLLSTPSARSTLGIASKGAGQWLEAVEAQRKQEGERLYLSIALALELLEVIRPLRFSISAWEKSAERTPTSDDIRVIHSLVALLVSRGFIKSTLAPPPYVIESEWTSDPVVLAVIHGKSLEILTMDRVCLWCKHGGKGPTNIIGVYNNERDITEYYSCFRCHQRIERAPPFLEAHVYFTEERFQQICRYCCGPLRELEILQRNHCCTSCAEDRVGKCLICSSNLVEGGDNCDACKRRKAEAKVLALKL